MGKQSEELTIKIWGDLACFTRPEYATERVSYPCITPPAAVGFLSAIFWKPEFDWRIKQIGLLKQPSWLSMSRNEVTARASSQKSDGSLKGISAVDQRVQRHSLMLRDVAYLVTSQIELRQHATDPVKKYSEQFKRRVKKGAFFTPPYLGLREYTGFFAESSEEDKIDTSVTLPIGSMPLDLGYKKYVRTQGGSEHRENPSVINPTWFEATITEGILEVPPITAGEMTDMKVVL